MSARVEVAMRPMLKGDLKRVMTLEKGIFSDPWPSDAFEEHMDDSEAGALVAEIESETVAYACYQLENHTLHLTNLAVDRACRRKSVAKQVLDRIFDVARDRRCELVFLEVRVSNEAARCFYEASGFRTIKRLTNYYESPPEDALVMMHRLGVTSDDR